MNTEQTFSWEQSDKYKKFFRPSQHLLPSSAVTLRQVMTDVTYLIHTMTAKL